jgi:HSP20 family protein
MSLFNNLLTSLNPAATSADTETAAANRPSLKPIYAINETPDAYRLTVQLPGVTKDGLELTADHESLRIIGRRAWTQPAGWTALHRETPDVGYELVLNHDNEIDADKIGAELRDGVLQVTLPKHETLKPRKIAVT